MREIKFRVWSGEAMISPDFINREGVAYWEENSITESAGVDKIMQYTGLKDKNGKEIYEGDIVTKPDDMFPSISIVNWDEERCGFLPFNYYSSQLEVYESEECPYCYEVIGNKYENPELLNE